MSSLKGSFEQYKLRVVVIALVAALGLVAAGASMARGGVAGAKHSAASAAVKTRKVSGLGVILVNPSGRTLYAFMKDARRHVTCTGQCASFWHPLKWAGKSKPTAGGTAKSALLSSDKDPAGGRVVTYSKWPLYTYSGDSAAGQAKGEGLNLNGAKWYAISAKGTLVKHKSSSGGGGGTTTTGGGGGWG